MISKNISYCNKLLTVVRLVATLLLFLGVNMAWGQDTDYSGIYLIANNNDKNPYYNIDNSQNNYYMCPTKGYVFYVYENNKDKYTTSDTGMPFITTYQCYNHIADYALKDALWEIQKVGSTSYYYIIHKESGKYLTFNGKIDGATKDGRMRFHLEDITNTPTNKSEFTITLTGDGYYNISPRNSSSNYLNPAKGNYDNLAGAPGDNNAYVGKEGAPSGISIYGIVGIYNVATDVGSKWYFEVPAPTFSLNSENKIEMSALGNSDIYYTTDGSTPVVPTAGEEPSEPTMKYSSAISLVNNQIMIKAIATNKDRNTVNSPVITYVYNPTITLSQTSYEYNATERRPSISSVKINNTNVSSTEYSVSYSDNIDAGTAKVTLTDSKNNNYIVNGSTTFIINPKSLTITANSKTITYGDAPANDGVTYSGFVGEQDESVLEGTLVLACDYAQYVDVGSYAITPSGLTSNNYNISYVDGTLTVNQKEVGLTWSETTTFPYDGTSHCLTATATGMVNGDQIGVTVTGAQTDAGDYNATASELTGTKAGNYKLPTANTKAFSITPVALTITANPKTITYGDAPANDGVNYSGFIEGEDENNLTGTLAYVYSYSQYGDVGDYTITPSGLTSTNYSISYNNGTLTVNKKEVGLDWTNTELVYNGSEQAPTATATELVNSDEIAVTVTGAQTNAGTDYIATASALTGTKTDNYQMPTDNTQTFTIAPKSLGDGETAAEGITIDITVENNTLVLNSVKDGKTTLVEYVDYTYDIQEEGTDKIVEIDGIGNYTGGIKGVYVCPVFTDPDETSTGPYVAVYLSKHDFALPSGVNACIVRSVNPTIGTLTISELEYIPKDVPVLLLSDTQISGFLAAEKDESKEEISAGTANSNLLKVAPTGGVAVKTAEVYIYYKGEFVLSKEGTVKTGNFYVHNPNFTDNIVNQTTPARGSLQIVFEQTTGITDISTKENISTAADVWYSLDGRRLSGKPTKQGLYIQNGRKKIIK